jgi:hypothetical protein
MDIYFSGEI